MPIWSSCVSVTDRVVAKMLALLHPSAPAARICATTFGVIERTSLLTQLPGGDSTPSTRSMLAIGKAPRRFGSGCLLGRTVYQAASRASSYSSALSHIDCSSSSISGPVRPSDRAFFKIVLFGEIFFRRSNLLLLINASNAQLWMSPCSV
jgi:hypothetical protein